MTEVLSLWKSPLDKVALLAAEALPGRQPRCSIGLDEDFSAMTVYNFGAYDPSPGGSGVPQRNVTALTNMLAAMAAPPSPYGVGGVAFIEQATFLITASSTAFSVPDQCNIFAAGTGGSDSSNEFYHFVISGTGGFTFLSCSGSAYTTGGTYLQWLAFRWEGSTNVGDTCVLAAIGNCCAIRCTFTDCPLAFSAQAPGCALEQCTIDYSSGPAGATAVVIAGSQCAILGPAEFLQNSPDPNKGGPQSCTCISVQGGADHTVIADMHISDWTTGVDFSQSDGSTNTHIRSCEIQSYIVALNIVGNGAPITGLKVTSTLLARTTVSGESQNPSPVVLIDLGSSTVTQLSDITLLNCTVYNMGDASGLTGQHGLQIVGGTNIKVIGGTYSNNSPSFGAGIAITGACGDVQIIGANLQPSYDDGTVGSAIQSQFFGLLVTTNPVGTVLVSGCDVRGYGTTTAPGSAVSTSGVTQGLYIYDCLGYNDQNTELNGNAPPTSSPGLSAATCSSPYFGPSIITFTNATPVTLNVFGQSLILSFGVVFLPSPYDSFWFDSVPTGFSWYGK